MAEYSLGSLVVELGADVRGLTEVSKAMLKMQEEVLASVNKMVAALDRIEKKGIRVSKNTTKTVIEDEKKKREEYLKTAKTQESLGNKNVKRKNLAISPAEIRNVKKEESAYATIALANKTTVAIVKKAVEQRLALAREAKKEADEIIRQAERKKQNAIRIETQLAKEKEKIAQRDAAVQARIAKQNAATQVKIAQQATAMATTQMNNMFQPFKKDAIASLSMVSQRLRTFGYLASATLTAPIVLAGKAIVKLASDFEFSMQKIVGLTGTAQSTVNEWADQIKLIGREFGKKPQELAEGLYYIASSGIKGAQALDVLKLSAKAAAAGLGDTQSVANYLTSVLNAYRNTGLTAAYATDVLVAAVREGKAEASGFASAMGSVTPIASLLGVSIDQVAGAMSAMTLTGSTAAQAATYLRGIFNGLMKESEGGAEAMEAASGAIGGMGTSYEELRNILQTGGVIALVKKLNDLSAVYGETLVSKVFPNIRAMTGILSLSGKNMQYNSEMIKRITESQGSLGKAFAAVSDTIKIRYDRALVAANIALIEVGKTIATAFLPILEKWVGWLEVLIRWFNNMDQGWKNFIMWILKALAVLGPLNLALSILGYTIVMVRNIINGFGTQIAKLLIKMGALKVATDGTTASVMLFGKAVKGNTGMFGALIKNPYVLVAAGAIAAGIGIAALIRKHNEFNRIQKKVAGDTAIEAGTMQGLFNRAKDLTRSLEQRKKTIETINDKYGDYLKNLLTEKSSVEEIAKAYEQASKQLEINIALKMNQDALESNMQKTAKAFKSGLDDVLKVINEQKPDMLAEFYNDVYALTEEAIKRGKGKVDWTFLQSGKVGLIDKYLKGLEISAGKYNDLVEEFLTGVDKVARKKVQEFELQNFVDTLTTKFDKLTDAVKKTNEVMGRFKLPDVPIALPTEMPKLASDILGSIRDMGKGQTTSLPIFKDLKVDVIQVNKAVNDAEKKMKEFFEGKGYQFGLSTELDKLLLETYATANSIKKTGAEAKKMGNEFDTNGKLVEIYNKVIEELQKTTYATSPVMMLFVKWLNEAKKESKSTKDELKTLRFQKVFVGLLIKTHMEYSNGLLQYQSSKTHIE